MKLSKERYRSRSSHHPSASRCSWARDPARSADMNPPLGRSRADPPMPVGQCADAGEDRTRQDAVLRHAGSAAMPRCRAPTATCAKAGLGLQRPDFAGLSRRDPLAQQPDGDQLPPISASCSGPVRLSRSRTRRPAAALGAVSGNGERDMVEARLAFIPEYVERFKRCLRR